MSELTFLRSQHGSRPLSRAEAARLLETSERRTFAPGTTIVRRGDPGDAMFVIVEGAVEIRVTGDDGRVRFTAHLEKGDIFGEMALLMGEPRIADVIATEPCTCLVVGQEDLEARLRDHPALAAFLTEILGARILESDAMRQVGKYHLVGVIGRGSMATVFEGFHLEMRRPVAVKMLSHSLVYQSDIQRRFRDEARIMASLRHENIVQVYDLEEAYRTWFIVMERLPGQDLERCLAQHGPLPAVEVRSIAYQVASALAYAHDLGVVHRDIKPSNLFRLPDGTVRLVDFGIASFRLDRAAETESDLLCSPAYVAPEIVEGREVDGRSDLYSLGATVYRLLTGKVPFPHPQITQVLDAHVSEPFPDVTREVPDLPEDLQTLIRRTTAKRPEDRFQSAHEIVDLLAPRVAAAAGGPDRGLVIRLTYPPEEARGVADLVEAVKARIEANPRIQVRFSAEGDPPPPG